ncbi:MAG: hypothetical protein PF440_01155 [Thiomicrorhabdus sp.]|jgi:hypothetical protein|nr:hypothetical protein [Thiomicrorhabdus sp.]
MITAEQFAEWKEHPVTKEIFEELKKEKEILKTRLATGFTVNESAESTQYLTSKAVGQLEGLNQLLNISYEDDEVVEDVSDLTGH